MDEHSSTFAQFQYTPIKDHEPPKEKQGDRFDTLWGNL